MAGWHACRRPDFLIAQKVSKDAPGRGKIPNLSPLPGPSPHSNGQKGSSPFWITPRYHRRCQGRSFRDPGLRFMDRLPFPVRDSTKVFFSSFKWQFERYHNSQLLRAGQTWRTLCAAALPHRRGCSYPQGEQPAPPQAGNAHRPHRRGGHRPPARVTTLRRPTAP